MPRTKSPLIASVRASVSKLRLETAGLRRTRLRAATGLIGPGLDENSTTTVLGLVAHSIACSRV